MAIRKNTAKKAVKKTSKPAKSKSTKIRALRIVVPSVQNMLAHPHFQGVQLKQKRNTIEAYRGNDVILTVDAREVRSARALEEKLVDALLAIGALPSKSAFPPPAKITRRGMKAAFDQTAPVVDKPSPQLDAGALHVGRLQDISQALVALDRLSRDLPTIVDILKARGRQEDVSLRSVLGIAECGLYEPAGTVENGAGFPRRAMLRHNVPNPNMLLQSVGERMYLVGNLLMQEASAVSAPGGFIVATEAGEGKLSTDEQAAQVNERG